MVPFWFGLYGVQVFQFHWSALKYCLLPFGSLPLSGETALEPLVTMELNSSPSRMFWMPEPFATMSSHCCPQPGSYAWLGGKSVPLEGLEPPTVSLGRNCSSIELQRLARPL